MNLNRCLTLRITLGAIVWIVISYAVISVVAMAQSRGKIEPKLHAWTTTGGMQFSERADPAVLSWIATPSNPGPATASTTIPIANIPCQLDGAFNFRTTSAKALVRCQMILNGATVFDQTFQLDPSGAGSDIAGSTFSFPLPFGTGEIPFKVIASVVFEISTDTSGVGFFWNDNYRCFFPACGNTPIAGTLAASPSSGPPGTTVAVTGTGWKTGAGTTFYRLLFDGTVAASQGGTTGLSCDAQPNMTFTVSCDARRGTRTITNQLVDSFTGQVLASASTTFEVTTSTVAPLASACEPGVTIEPLALIPKSATASVKVTLFPSPAITPITLVLSTKRNTKGSAVFASNNSTSLTINQTSNVEIKGVVESDVAENIELEATRDSRAIARIKFSVLWVTLSIRTSGTVSRDNDAHRVYQQQLELGGNLGTFFTTGATSAKLWRTGVEIVGTVMPSNFREPIILKRDIIESRLYDDMTLIQVIRVLPDTSDPILRDDVSTSGGSKGKVYDLDAPGLGVGPTSPIGRILRRRINFRQFATVQDGRGNELIVSDDLLWFSRLSVIKQQAGDKLREDIPGDNVAGEGMTNLSADLKTFF